MKTSILICATCFIVTGCSAQLRFPSLSSALSSLTGYSGSNGGSGSSQSVQSSPYSGLVRDYGRNLMMAMSSIYPTLFKPPQSQQQQPQQQQNQPQQAHSPFDTQFSSSQNVPQGYFPGQQPSFSFGGSTFSISPSLPFGSLTGASQPQPSASGPNNSPFSASFGSSINSPSSFGPLSSSPYLSQSMQSFAPASSYNAAFESANGGQTLGSPSFMGGLSSGQGLHSNGQSLSNPQLASQSSNPSSINTYPNFNSQHDMNSPISSQSAHQPQSVTINQQSGLGVHSSMPSTFSGPQQAPVSNQQFSSQQYRPDMMSIAASAPVPSSNSYSNYGSMPSAPSQQAPVPSSSYQQPSYR